MLYEIQEYFEVVCIKARDLLIVTVLAESAEIIMQNDINYSTV